MANQELRFKITADNRGFTSAMKGTIDAVKFAAKWVAVAGAAGAAGIAAYAYAAYETAEALEAIGREAAKLGIDVGQYQRLATAAYMADVPVEALTKAILIQQETLAKAAAGGSQRTIFRQMGLDVEALRRLSPEQQFTEIASALARVQNQGDRVALTKALFGRGGTALLPMLAKGEAGIRGMMGGAGADGATL